MLDRMTRATVPDKHHTALRDDGGRLRYEECLTRDGFDGPVHDPLPPATGRTRSASPPPSTAGRCRAGGRRRRRARRSRGATTARRSSRGAAAPPIDARVPLLFNDDVVAVGRAPRRAPTRSTSPTATATSSSSSSRAAARCARRSATSRSRRATTCSCRAGSCTASCSTPGAAALAVASSAPAGFGLLEAVAQRGRPAPHGRAVLPPRLPPPRLSPARSTKGMRELRGQARRRVPRLPLRALAARRRRLGRHGLPVGVPDPALPAARRPRCTCRRPCTARSRRAAR